MDIIEMESLGPQTNIKKESKEKPKEFFLDLLQMFNSLASSKDMKDRIAAMNWLDSFLQSHNLPPDKMFEAWKNNAKFQKQNKKTGEEYSEAEARKDLSSIIIKNLALINRIESEHPGISQHLREQYGIENFARFSTQTWINQYEDREKSKPFGLVVAAKDDWNGASYKESSYDTYEKLRTDLQPDHSLKIIEANSIPELARLLVRIEKKYNRKPEFLIWSGHASKEFFLGPGSYGKENYQFYLAKDDFKGEALERMQSYLNLFSKDTVMIVDACLREEKNNLAAVAAQATGQKFIYPNGETSVEDFGVMKDANGNLSFDVKYNFGIDTLNTEK